MKEERGEKKDKGLSLVCLSVGKPASPSALRHTHDLLLPLTPPRRPITAHFPLGREGASRGLELCIGFKVTRCFLLVSFFLVQVSRSAEQRWTITLVTFLYSEIPQRFSQRFIDRKD